MVLTVWDGCERVRNVNFSRNAHAQRAILFSRSKCACATEICFFPLDVRMLNSTFYVLFWILSLCVRHTWVEYHTYQARVTNFFYSKSIKFSHSIKSFSSVLVLQKWPVQLVLWQLTDNRLENDQCLWQPSWRRRGVLTFASYIDFDTKRLTCDTSNYNKL